PGVTHQALGHVAPQHVGDQAHLPVGGNAFPVADRHSRGFLTPVLQCDQPVGEQKCGVHAGRPHTDDAALFSRISIDHNVKYGRPAYQTAIETGPGKTTRARVILEWHLFDSMGRLPAMRSLISLPEIGAADVAWIVARALKLADDPEPPRTLAGRAVGTSFRRSSTRTRTSFWRAATLLGAEVITFGPDDLQLCTGESLADTARVLGGYLDVLVVRTNDDIAELRELARVDGLAIVNA